MHDTSWRPRLNQVSLQVTTFLLALMSAFNCFSQDFSVTSNSATISSDNSSVTNTPLTVPVKYSALSIGDRMPDISFSMMNYPNGEEAHISDFKGKLVILDFWATWCGSCISKFPKLDSLQEVYKDQLQIILVNSNNTGDNETKVKDFFAKRKNLNGQPYQLAVAYQDSLASILFPHREVPHYAWITSDGRVRAITDAHEVNAENIESIINNEKINLSQKKDFFPNKLMDLGQGETEIDDNLVHYSVFKKGKIEGVSYVNQMRLVKDEKGNDYNIRGEAMRNMPLMEMYKEAIRYNRQLINFNSDKQIILETKSNAAIIFDPTFSTKGEWERNNLCTYDLVVPTNEADSLYSYIIQDLNRYSGFNGKMEKRKMNCLVLVKTSKADKIKTKGGEQEYLIYDDQPKKYMHNLPLSQLVMRLDRMENIKLPVKDETGYTGNVDLDLSVNLNDLTALRKALQHYDLNLIEKEKEIDVFVLTDK